MGYILSILLCFLSAFVIQYVYSWRKVEKDYTFIYKAGVAFMLSILIVDSLVIFGVFDGLLVFFNYIPGVTLPVQNTGLYWYFNCLFLGFFNLGIPIINPLAFLILALIMEATYVSVYRNGTGWGKLLFGKRPTQTGALPFLKPLGKPKNWREMEAKWKEEAPKRKSNEEYSNKIIEEGLELAEKLGMKDKIEGFVR